MAVPWINFLAPSMGGIGPIEISDFNKLQDLTEYNGIPFYAGRFYPKDSQAVFSGLEIGLFSETPPWVTWEVLKSTQIWMVPAFEDERILSMDVTVERIDIWPRDKEDIEYLPEYEETPYDEAIRGSAWGHETNARLYPNIDPGIIITNNVVPPALFLGYVGISTVTGYVSEFPFYDQELTIINAPQYNMPDLEESDSELLHIRGDGVWRQNPAIIPEFGEPLVIEKKNGYPTFQSGFKNTTPNTSYDLLAISTEESDAKTFGSPKWDELTRRGFGNKPRVGTIAEVKSSQLDTVVITLKVSCATVIIPDVLIPDDVATGLVEYGKIGLETFASNLSNNIWYFYWPVRYNGDFVPDRIQFLLNRTAVNEPGAFD